MRLALCGSVMLSLACKVIPASRLSSRSDRCWMAFKPHAHIFASHERRCHQIQKECSWNPFTSNGLASPSPRGLDAILRARSMVTSLRTMVITLLSEAVGGDRLAAAYVLCTLLSKVVRRQEGVLDAVPALHPHGAMHALLAKMAREWLTRIRCRNQTDTRVDNLMPFACPPFHFSLKIHLPSLSCR